MPTALVLVETAGPPEVLELRRPGQPSVWLLVRALFARCSRAARALLARDELVSMASHEGKRRRLFIDGIEASARPRRTPSACRGSCRRSRTR